MISKKGKRKLVYEEQIFYWYIKKDAQGVPQIRIISEDKKVQLTYGFDRELSISPAYIRALLERYFLEKSQQ